MATLTVWRFDTATGASQAIEKLGGLQKQQLVEIYDAATVSWPKGRKKPQINQAFNLVDNAHWWHLHRRRYDSEFRQWRADFHYGG